MTRADRASTTTIMHVDMDAFFVSVELTRRPELRGQPVIVGGDSRRGVVAAASYEARAYGVHSAMPSVQARRLCPHAIFLPGDHAMYSSVSTRVMAIFGRYTPLVEPLSLDEAFLDVTGALRLFGDAVVIANRIRHDVLSEEQLACSVGIAPNKFLAKMASETAKPRAGRDGPVAGLGVKVIERGAERSFLDPLPVSRLWGVGPKTLARLERLGVSTIADVAALPVTILRSAIGDAASRHLHELAHGRDDRRVETGQRVKSVGHEETYSFDHHTFATIDTELVRLSDAVAGRLRDNDLGGRTVTLKVRMNDFTTLTRSVTVAQPVQSGSLLAQLVKELVRSIDPSPGVRLLGVSVSKLVDHPTLQLTLDEVTDVGAPRAAARADVDAAIDQVRQRFGADAIGPAGLIGARGLRTKRRGDQQWGPNDAPAKGR
ncbi:MAG: DNA polymerase IV [Acidimicrobiales bacterium]